MLSGEFPDGTSVSGGTKSFWMGIWMWVSSSEGVWRSVGVGREGVEEKWEIGLVLGVERREKVMWGLGLGLGENKKRWRERREGGGMKMGTKWGWIFGRRVVNISLLSVFLALWIGAASCLCRLRECGRERRASHILDQILYVKNHFSSTFSQFYRIGFSILSLLF